MLPPTPLQPNLVRSHPNVSLSFFLAITVELNFSLISLFTGFAPRGNDNTFSLSLVYLFYYFSGGCDARVSVCVSLSRSVNSLQARRWKHSRGRAGLPRSVCAPMRQAASARVNITGMAKCFWQFFQLWTTRGGTATTIPIYIIVRSTSYRYCFARLIIAPPLCPCTMFLCRCVRSCRKKINFINLQKCVRLRWFDCIFILD